MSMWIMVKNWCPPPLPFDISKHPHSMPRPSHLDAYSSSRDCANLDTLPMVYIHACGKSTLSIFLSTLVIRSGAVTDEVGVARAVAGEGARGGQCHGKG